MLSQSLLLADIYANWLPGQWYYAFHLFAWMLPIILLQWLGFHRILAAHWRQLAATTLLLGTYLVATDIVAIHYGIWHFDPERILGLSPLGVPVEEWCFFYLTVLLVSQSFLLFLPSRYRLDAKQNSVSIVQ